MSKLCYNCIHPRVCYLTKETDNNDKEIGWCDDCNNCKCCDKKIKFRIYWDVGCSNSPFRLCRDVCEDHQEVPTDCSCSKTQRNYSTKEYVYE